MNKVKNWIIVSVMWFIGAVVSVGVPVVALVFFCVGLLACFMALLRYEDAIGYIGKFSWR